MKKVKSIALGLFFAFVIGFLAYQQLPIMYDNYQSRGVELPFDQVLVHKTGFPMTFPPQGRSLVIIWASWCGPCTLEMNRIKASIEAGTINSNQVFAVNPYETIPVVRRYIEENDYPFVFIEDSGYLTRHLQFRATPTFILFEENRIKRITTGINVIGIYRIESFLRS